MYTTFDFTCNGCGATWSTKRWYPDLEPYENCPSCEQADVLAGGTIAEGGFEEGEPAETAREQYLAAHAQSLRLHS